MKYDVITIGGATEDISIFTPEGRIIDNPKDLLCQKLLAFEYGAKIKVDRSYSDFGGGAANAAVSISGLGLKSAAILAVGDDERGQRIKVNLRQRSVSDVLVKKVKSQESGFSFIIITPAKDRIIFSSRGANNYLILGAAEKAALKKASWAYVTSLSGAWKKDLDLVFSVSGLRVAWNPGHPQLQRGIKFISQYLKRTAILFLNHDEALELVLSIPGMRNNTSSFLNNTKNLLSAIKAFGPQIVVITDGAKGASAYDGSNFYKQPAIKGAKKIDATGVGDAFNSAVIAGLKIYHEDLAKALHLGARNAANLMTKLGAQNGLLTKKDL